MPKGGRATDYCLLYQWALDIRFARGAVSGPYSKAPIALHVQDTLHIP